MLRIDSDNSIPNESISAIVSFKDEHYKENLIIDLSKGNPRSVIFTREGITYISLYKPNYLKKVWKNKKFKNRRRKPWHNKKNY